VQDFAETLISTVAAMSAASFGYFGVTLKEEQGLRAQRPTPAVVRRVAAPAPPQPVVRQARVGHDEDCDLKRAVKV
jgi:hypothetical protein